MLFNIVYSVINKSAKGSVNSEMIVPVAYAAAAKFFSPSNFSAKATMVAAGGILMAITGASKTYGVSANSPFSLKGNISR